MGGCGPHCCVCCHLVGTNSDSLDNLRGPRHLVRRHSTETACSASDRAEEITARTICGSTDASGVLVADSHARLDSVGSGLTAVRRVERRTGEVLATVYGVNGTIGVGVVPTTVGGAKCPCWRRDCGGGRRRNSSTATVRWRKVAGRARCRGNTTVRRR